ncbi:hypothetical protein [Actinacidiphila sp. bgisy160]|uniref:hypothetical protein n=1 Tax=Actinacidiphila sp. bgisy160 TaxID=3413796 RepID=UPI003D70F91D
MDIDLPVLDQEARRLALLMTENGMEHLTIPATRSPQEAGAAIEERFSAELGVAYARLAAAGSDEQAILPSLLMAMAGQVAMLAIELSLRTDRDAADVIRSMGGGR